MVDPDMPWPRGATRYSRFELACIAFIVLGLGTRLLIFAYKDINWDAAWYLVMGKTLVTRGEFLEPWAPFNVYTHHFPPAYPVLLGLGILAFGPSYLAAGVVACFTALFLVGVTFFTTRDLYGRTRALAATAVVATFPILSGFDVQILSESLVAAFFALTIWGILKSLDRPKFIVVAGLFAGLGYLTKASMGPFFLLAGAGGFAWRFYYVRWNVFRDKWYLLAGSIFALFVIPWALRNVLRFGWPHWETQPHANESLHHLFYETNWSVFLFQEFLWGSLILLVFALPFLPETLRSFKKIREERTSALWLAVITPSIVGMIFAAAFDSFEGRPIVTDSTVRYLITPIIPLLWLGLREMDFSEARPAGAPTSGRSSMRARAWLLTAGIGLLAFLLATDPVLPYISTPRFTVYLLLGAVGVATILVARAYAWQPAFKQERDGTRSWRAVHATMVGAPPVLLAVAGLALAVSVTLGVAIIFFAFCLPGVAALAAASPRARVIAFCAIAVAMPLAHYAPQAIDLDVARDLNAEVPHGAIIATSSGREHWLYPFLRDDLRMITPDRPHDYYVDIYPGSLGPIPPEGFVLVRQYNVTWSVGPGTSVGLFLYGHIFADQDPPAVYVNVNLFRAANSTVAPASTS